MEGLIMMLHNVAQNTWHPIMYAEKFFPGGMDPEHKVVRFQSKGHHTEGYKTREEALASVPELKAKMLLVLVSTVTEDLEKDIPWDGEGVPIDTQLRKPVTT